MRITLKSASAADSDISDSDFTSTGPSSVAVLDLQQADNGLRGFKGGFASGDAAYVISGGPSGKIARVLLSDFTPAGVSVLDLTTVDSTLKVLPPLPASLSLFLLIRFAFN